MRKLNPWRLGTSRCPKMSLLPLTAAAGLALWSYCQPVCLTLFKGLAALWKLKGLGTLLPV